VASSRFPAGTVARRAFPATSPGFAVPAVLTANLIWGLSFVATKPLLDHLPPASLAVARLLIALAVLIPLLRLTGRSIALGKGPALLGVTGIAMTVLFQNLGLQRTSATNAACLASVVPVIALVMAYFLLKSRPAPTDLVAAVLSVVGVLVIVLGDIGGASMSPGGDLLILASSASLALYLVLGRKYFSESDPVSLVAGSSLYGMLVLLPVAGFEVSRNEASMPDANGMVCLILLGLGASALAYCLEGSSLRQISAGQVAMVGNLAPVVGVVAGALLLREGLTLSQAAGALLAVGGAWLATCDLCRRPTARRAMRLRVTC